MPHNEANVTPRSQQNKFNCASVTDDYVSIYLLNTFFYKEEIYSSNCNTFYYKSFVKTYLSDSLKKFNQRCIVDIFFNQHQPLIVNYLLIMANTGKVTGNFTYLHFKKNFVACRSNKSGGKKAEIQ